MPATFPASRRDEKRAAEQYARGYRTAETQCREWPDRRIGLALREVARLLNTMPVGRGTCEFLSGLGDALGDILARRHASGMDGLDRLP